MCVYIYIHIYINKRIMIFYFNSLLSFIYLNTYLPRWREKTERVARRRSY